MRKVIVGMICGMLSLSSFAAEQVMTDAGNIYFSPDGNTKIQITDSGKDHGAVLSADKRLIAFIRESDAMVPKCSTASNSANSRADQIWIYDFATKKSQLLVADNKTCGKPEEMIIGVNELQFSKDNKILYFQTSAWETASALHAVNIDGTHQRYIKQVVS